MNFDLLFRGAKFFHNGYLAYFLSERDEIWQRWGTGQSRLITRRLLIPCGDMHQSFTGTILKWFFDKFSMFADSFSILSIHC